MAAEQTNIVRLMPKVPYIGIEYTGENVDEVVEFVRRQLGVRIVEVATSYPYSYTLCPNLRIVYGIRNEACENNEDQRTMYIRPDRWVVITPDTLCVDLCSSSFISRHFEVANE